MKDSKPSLRPAAIVDRARSLLQQGKSEEARELLLDEGFIKRIEPTLQEAYLSMFPAGATLAEMLAQVYRGLQDRDPKIRLKAATALSRECAKVYPKDNVRWMRDPRATEPLIKVVDQDPDAKVVDRALPALACMLCSYFPDQRALAALVAKLRDPLQDVRVSAISAVGCLRQEEALMHLAPLLKGGSDRDRLAVVSTISGLAYETEANLRQRPIAWSAGGKRFWIDEMMDALGDPAAGVRKPAVVALKHFEATRALPALHSALEKESDENTAFFMRDAIAELEAKR